METLAQVEAALDRLANYEKTAPPPGGFRLQRMERLVAALDHPEQAYRVVHVAGTKGKGTTSAAIASALDAAGLKVGLYTSPHLIHLRERIRIGALPAAEEAWVTAAGAVFAAVEQVLGGDPPTWFELVTAIALVVFREAGVDVAVLEVGLGGRLDATNVVTPAVSVITRIARDHTALLGDDERAIAGEKAGIIKPGVPVVAGPVQPDAARMIAERAEAVGAPWTSPPLPAAAHDQNLALARAAIEVLGKALGRELSAGVEPGFARLRLRGRFDVVEHRGQTFSIDGAHDPVSARALLEAYRARFDAPPLLVVGMARDKDLRGFLEVLAPHAVDVICCAANTPRAAEPGRLALLAEEIRGRSARAVETSLDAHLLAEAERVPVLVTGSLYLAGEFLRHLGQDAGPAWDVKDHEPSP